MNDTRLLTRRSVLAGSAALGLAAALAACSGSGAGSGKPLKFWNMPWGGVSFNPLDKKISQAYRPAHGLPPVTYQAVQWANFVATFASAIASKTGPAVSSGSGTQAFQFAEQGQIAYADDLLDSWKKNGLHDDFLPGLLDTMKTPKGYVAVPYNLDMRALWLSAPLLQKAGVQAPTDWQSYLDACEALKKIGAYGFGISAGPQGNGFQVLVGLLINNGGGLFDEEQKPRCVTDENVQALEFVVEMIRKGYVDPGSVGYSTDNAQAQWKAGKFAMGFEGPGLASNLGGTFTKDIVIGDPLTGATGKKGALFFPNNIMMYTNTPSQKGSEAFLTYYYKNMAPLWTQHTGIGLPVLRSIAETPEFKSDPNAAKLISDWQPICKTWAAPGGDALFANVTIVDSTTPMTDWAQNVLSLKETPKESLQTLQTRLEGALKK
ncbi:ABC transporter substrate-binding protein [Pseudolysinimonas sp.]|uniref:ABC transporter substrate-binding protein n=1 Tax=Pseudolysinimonas sp. TaxID=2680009 RepID=UPI003F7F55C3